MDYDIRARLSAAKKLWPKAKGGKGLAFTLRRPGGVYDPLTMGVTAGDFDQPCGGLELSYDQKAIDGNSILQGDKQVMIAALRVDNAEPIVEPEANWLYVIEGEPERLIVTVDKFGPAGLAIYYTLQVRGK